MVDAASSSMTPARHAPGVDEPELALDEEQPAKAIPLKKLGAAEDEEPLVAGESAAHSSRRETLEPGRSLVISDFAPPSHGLSDRLVRFAYGIGVPPSTLAKPFAKLGARVEETLTGLLQGSPKAIGSRVARTL